MPTLDEINAAAPDTKASSRHCPALTVARIPSKLWRTLRDDAPDHARRFGGVYVAGPLKSRPKGQIDAYYLGIDRKSARFGQTTAREIRHSVGTRLSGKGTEWDYNYELVYQWGWFGPGEIRAWTVASDSGYVFNGTRFRPRPGIKANITSGDHDPADTKVQTFNALFPKGAYFGEIALIGPSNHMDLHPSIELRLTEAITVTADSVFFWRESMNDGIYGSATNVLQSGSANPDRFVGSQPSLHVEWKVGSHVSWVAVVSQFVPGSFLSEAGPARTVHYVTSWVSYRF